MIKDKILINHQKIGRCRMGFISTRRVTDTVRWTVPQYHAKKIELCNHLDTKNWLEKYTSRGDRVGIQLVVGFVMVRFYRPIRRQMDG